MSQKQRTEGQREGYACAFRELARYMARQDVETLDDVREWAHRQQERIEMLTKREE